MRNKGLWYVGGVSMAVAVVLGYGSALSELGRNWSVKAGAERGLQRSVRSAPAAISAIEKGAPGRTQVPQGLHLLEPAPQWPDVAQVLPSRDTLHWPSIGFGLVSGIVLTLLALASWLELPSRFVRWFAANERNFYRLGIAAGCLAVLLFY